MALTDPATGHALAQDPNSGAIVDSTTLPALGTGKDGKPVPVPTLGSLTSEAAWYDMLRAVGAPGMTSPSSKASGPMTADQAYWAQQPAAIQALQRMDPAERMAAGEQLAKQGYAIDVPIMIWQWPPLQTMLLRQEDGYTWVPSALQPPVVSPPGFSVAGYPAYDPNSPPPGSIRVTTDFAKGTTDEARVKDFQRAITSGT